VSSAPETAARWCTATPDELDESDGICPRFPGARVHDATFWLGRSRAALMTTVHGAWVDVFWFSVFHELGHLLLHGRRQVILKDDDADPALRTLEDEADRFATDSLIAPRDYQRFVAAGDVSQASIQAFAAGVGIAAGMVVGRLRHNDHLRHDRCNELRTRFTWASETTATP